MSEAVCKDNDIQRALADLEKASEGVRVAAGALQLAEKNLERAEAELKDARERPRTFRVNILYNGLKREIDAKSDELVKVLLACKGPARLRDCRFWVAAQSAHAFAVHEGRPRTEG